MPVHRRPISLYLLSVLSILSAAFHVAAQDSRSFDCHFSVEDAKYDISELGGARVLNRTRESPPSTYVDELRFDLCADLTEVEDRAPEDQCSSNTMACLTTINQKEGSPDRITSVIPIAQSTSPDVETTMLSSPEGVVITLHGISYPSSPANSVPQSLKISLACAESTIDPQFSSYENGQVLVEWGSPVVCRTRSPKEDDEGSGGGGGGKEEDTPIENVGSGLGFFFFMLILAFVAYFAFGAYHNYSTYGARGWDLIPHRDFWREVPYMLQDVVAHLCTNVRIRRSSRGGYVAV